MKEKFKLTPLERSWVLYDVGNSAFILLVSTLIPIYFDALAAAGGVSESNYLAYWVTPVPSPPCWWPSSVPSAVPWRIRRASQSPSSC